MAGPFDGDWARRLVEELRQATYRRNFERMGWDATWVNPPWPGREPQRAPERGPAFAAVEEHLRMQAFRGRRGGDWFRLRQAFDASAEVRAAFREADERLRARRDEALEEARRRRRDAEAARAVAQADAEDAGQRAWWCARERLAALAGVPPPDVPGASARRAWGRAAAKLEALHRGVDPAVAAFLLGLDPGHWAAAFAYGYSADGSRFADFTGLAGCEP